MPNIRTNGILTYYESRGRGTPLVFIHGLTASHKAWSAQVEHFKKQYRTITYDLRGHAQSSSAKGAYSIEQMADDLNALLNALNIKKPVLCGLSLGGMIAQAYAVKYPQKLSALVLSDTLTKEPFGMLETLEQLITPKPMFGEKRNTLIARAYTGKSRFKHAFERAYTRAAYLFLRKKPSPIQKKIIHEFESFNRTQLIKHINAIHAFKGVMLNAISVPTLVLVGALEPRIIANESKQLAKHIPHATLCTIPGSVHVSNVENPQQFNVELEHFLKKY
ncbi:hypothetical protein COT72_02260 [archaeon CG10_big_fil_rev_8_21_14_0_10_43_11]|nr:MAG: hypothetical protein COT72_02260 [archaeon CG10_big_fil_rev_8_21_14_0_10_43_11]